MTGGGIYVEGNADSVVMSTSNSGGHSKQLFAIKQGSTTTTVTLDLTGNTTTISNGSTTKTVYGLPQNQNNLPATEACMLYVNGNISGTSGSTTTGLSGPSSGPAIQDGSAVTVTAAQNISITGNITYSTEPVTLNTADTLISGHTPAQQAEVLGIFTPGGNVDLAMPTAGGNLEIDAAIATIKDQGSGAITNTGNAISQLTIVGGRMQNTIQNINTTTRNIFYDGRFSQGGFAPPWFPSTTITSNGVVNAVVVVSPPTRLSWTDLSAQ